MFEWQTPTDADTPMWRQIRSDIRNAIAKGQLRPGQQIPTQKQLCEAYDCSTTTVREATKELASEGLIRKQGSRGTVVTNEAPDISHSQLSLHDQTPEAEQRLPGADYVVHHGPPTAKPKVPLYPGTEIEMKMLAGELVLDLTYTNGRTRSCGATSTIFVLQESPPVDERS